MIHKNNIKCALNLRIVIAFFFHNCIKPNELNDYSVHAINRGRGQITFTHMTKDSNKLFGLP